MPRLITVALIAILIGLTTMHVLDPRFNIQGVLREDWTDEPVGSSSQPNQQHAVGGQSSIQNNSTTLDDDGDDKTDTRKKKNPTVSRDMLLSLLEPNQLEQFDLSRPLFIDIGMNDGSDSLHHLNQNYSVIAVDANPTNVEKMKSYIGAGHEYYHRLLVFSVGVASPKDEGEILKFYYRNPRSPMASFDKIKACTNPATNKMMKNCNHKMIQVVKCSAVLGLVNKAPELLKVDIEMLHHNCIHALHMLETNILPKFVCWENHDKPFGEAQMPRPMIDVKLIMGLWQLGYDGIKIIPQGGAAAAFYPKGHDLGNGRYTSKLKPDELVHADPWIEGPQNSTAWQNIAQVMERGIMPQANLTGHMIGGLYYDVCMKLSPDATLLRSIREKEEHYPIAV